MDSHHSLRVGAMLGLQAGQRDPVKGKYRKCTGHGGRYSEERPEEEERGRGEKGLAMTMLAERLSLPLVWQP